MMDKCPNCGSTAQIRLAYEGATSTSLSRTYKCGCGASVLCSKILGDMTKGSLKNVLFVATGALMSPTSNQQGESIPSVAHLVHLKTQE